MTGATQHLLNAVYVRAAAGGESGLQGLPGVRRVVRMLPLKRQMNLAVDLVNTRQAFHQS